VPSMTSFHMSADHGVAGIEGNSHNFMVGKKNQERPENLGESNNSAKKGENFAIEGALNGEDLWGSVGNGMRAKTREELRDLAGERMQAQKGGKDTYDVLHEGVDVWTGKGKNVEEGTDARDGNGKKINMRQGGPSTFNFGSAGNMQGQQKEAHFMGKTNMGSPCPRPTLAKVEKTMARTSLGGGPDHAQGATTQLNVTWKRKARVVQTQSDNDSNLNSLGKRKVSMNGKEEMMGKKICNTCKQHGTEKFTLVDEDTGETENGLGMAMAGEQPRRL
jgi:hypothetical protein